MNPRAKEYVGYCYYKDAEQSHLEFSSVLCLKADPLKDSLNIPTKTLNICSYNRDFRVRDYEILRRAKKNN